MKDCFESELPKLRLRDKNKSILTGQLCFSFVVCVCVCVVCVVCVCV